MEKSFTKNPPSSCPLCSGEFCIDTDHMDRNDPDWRNKPWTQWHYYCLGQCGDTGSWDDFMKTLEQIRGEIVAE